MLIKENDPSFIKNLKIIFSLKISFSVLRKKPIIIYDDRYSRFLKNLFPVNKIEFFYTRHNYNFFILLKTFFNSRFRNFMNNYKKNYFRTIDPKFAITMNDKYKDFYKMKNFKNDVKTILIQSGTYGVYDKKHLINILKEIPKKKPIDYFFTFSKQYTEFLKNYLSGTKFFEIGSFRNNNYQKKNKLNSKSILFISGYKPGKTKYYGENFPKTEKITLKALEDYCEEKNFKLVIATRFKKKNDIRYFKKFLKNKVYFELKYFDDAIYESISSHNIIVSTDQTVGYEALAQRKKVIIVDPITKVTKFMKKKMTEKNKILIKNINKIKLFKSLNLFISTCQKDWVKILNSNFKDYIIDDPYNKKLRRNLKNMGLTLNKKFG